MGVFVSVCVLCLCIRMWVSEYACTREGEAPTVITYNERMCC